MELNSSFMLQAQVAMRGSGTPHAMRVPQNADEQAVWEAALEFEAYFIQVMFREMRNTIPNEGGILPTSHAVEIFQDMLDEQVSRSAASTGGIGLAQQLFRQFAGSNPIITAAQEYEQNE